MDVPQERPKNEPVKFKQKDARFTDCTQSVVTGVAVFTVDYPMREHLVAEKNGIIYLEKILLGFQN